MATPCPNCKEETDLDVCPTCGAEILSDSEAKMEEMVRQASIPNLASLFQAGKDAGLIKAGSEYGSAT